MKKLSILTLTVLISFSLFAKKVEIEEAKNVAKNYYSLQFEKIKGETIENLLILESFTLTKENDEVIYVFNFENGFVLVSSDDIATPVLGFSFEGKYTDNDQPPAFIEMLEHYKNQISYALENNLKRTSEIISEWEFFSNPENLKGYGECRIWPKFFVKNPLLTTTWNQDCYYNAKCPYDSQSPPGYCNHVPNGCVALAMAQVMKYWDYPEHGTGYQGYNDGASLPLAYGWQYANFGSTYYNWDEMPDVLTGSGLPTKSSSNSIDAVSTLIYHCGVSVNMDYGYNGSGAYTLDTRNALVNYFNYSSAASFKEKDNYSNSSWESLLRSSLKYNKPIIYQGHGSQGGHAFALDGYTKMQTECCTYYASFHINWGWGGNYNGYYKLTDLTPYIYNFNNNQGGVVGITPPNVSYTPPPQPGYISAACSPHCRDWEVEYEVSRVNSATSYEWEIIGGLAAVTWIDNYATVWSHHSGTFTLRVRAKNHNVPGPWQTETIEVENCSKDFGNTNHEGINYKSIKTSTLVNDLKNSKKIQIFPNPVKNNIHIYLPATKENSTIEFFDLQGKVHRIETTGNRHIIISTEGLNNGFYIIKIISNQTIEQKKILISK